VAVPGHQDLADGSDLWRRVPVDQVTAHARCRESEHGMIDGSAAQCECRQADLDCMMVSLVRSQVAAGMLQVVVVEAGIRAVNLGLASRQQRLLLPRRRERQP
jgi:hypothetical protein